eukprot:EG_transcript_13803
MYAARRPQQTTAVDPWATGATTGTTEKGDPLATLDSLLDEMEAGGEEVAEDVAAVESESPQDSGAEGGPIRNAIGLPLRLIARLWERSARNKSLLGASLDKYTQDVLTFDLDRGEGASLPLGLSLEEFFSEPNGIGLVLVEAVMPGGAAAALGNAGFQPGDTIIRIGLDEKSAARVEGRSLEEFRAALAGLAGKRRLTVWVKRMVERAFVNVTVVDPFFDNQTQLNIPAGRKLERALIERSLSDPSSRYLSCGGNGVCGTCAVQVMKGSDLLRPPSQNETYATKMKPSGTRLACQARVGFGNKSGDVVVKLLSRPPPPEKTV